MPARPPAPLLRLPPALVRAGLALRTETADDRDLIRALYAAARADELACAPWPAAVREAFLDAQFAAQSAHYAQHHGQADRLIVLDGGGPIGRIYIDRTRADWHLLDIVLAAEARGRGIGAALVVAVVRAARAHKAGVTLNVARDNIRAEALYRRLGFVETESASATHRAMRRG